ncbi:MAG: cytochrome-c peroxidase [Acidobacteriia bacterium]|nr:cytochrome-c peroxidase [Terriglobia bacterium]
MRAFLFLALAAFAQVRIPVGLDAFVPVPDDNPMTGEKVTLGRRLFLEKALSRDGSISCATCHDPERAYTDAKPLSVGVAGKRGSRRVPSILNRAYGKTFFWDGRIGALEEQVLQPIVNPLEMDLTIEEALARLRQTGRYPALDERSLSHALSSYVRSILSGNSAYDRYVAGDRLALPVEALAGLRLFRGKANCAACHLGPNLSDEQFHNTGIGFRDGVFSDAGRNLVTKRPEDRGAFKTPTLRQMAERAPYMHNGSLATIEDVIEHYDKGGVANPHLDAELQPLRLTVEEKRALGQFLRALSGEVREGL